MKTKYMLIGLFVALILGSCAEKKADQQSKEEVDGPQMELSVRDTSEVKKIANEFLLLVKERRIDEAVSMLYILDEDDVLQELTPSQKMNQKMALTMYPVYGYEITNIIFWKETDCRLDYNIFVSEPVEDEEPAKIGCALRPVRQDGIWHITVANTNAEYKVSEIKE